MAVYYGRKVAMRDVPKEKRPGETLVLNQVGPNWYNVDCYLTNAPAKIAGDWIQAVIAKLKTEGRNWPD